MNNAIGTPILHFSERNLPLAVPLGGVGGLQFTVSLRLSALVADNLTPPVP